MNCQWELVGDAGQGWELLECVQCGRRVKVRAGTTASAECGHAAAKPRGGVGTEIKRLFESLGVRPYSTCNCSALAAEWDRNGIAWCKAHRDDVLIPRLTEAYRKTDWLTVLRAAPLAAAQGLWSIESLVERAIGRAEQA